MCQIGEAGEMVARYFERAGKCRWKKGGLKSRYGGEDPMDYPHGCDFEILHLVASCL